MNHSKRHGEILRLLQEEGTITIAALAERLNVSLETIRRDVKPLTDGKAGFLTRLSSGTAMDLAARISSPRSVGMNHRTPRTRSMKS